MLKRIIFLLALVVALSLTAANSPSHTIASGNAERFSDDPNTYSAVAIFNRATNAHNMQVGGPEITPTTGGVTIAPNSGYLFQSAGGNRLSDIYVAGTSGDVADSIVYATRR
jgi:hypothetical protein